jgi:hypothetical protein
LTPSYTTQALPMPLVLRESKSSSMHSLCSPVDEHGCLSGHAATTCSSSRTISTDKSTSAGWRLRTRGSGIGG